MNYLNVRADATAVAEGAGCVAGLERVPFQDLDTPCPTDLFCQILFQPSSYPPSPSLFGPFPHLCLVSLHHACLHSHHFQLEKSLYLSPCPSNSGGGEGE